jgi:hypothetical protein
MTKSQKLTSHHKALLGRYLTWAYKSTKESFDRLERKTTQIMADEFIYRHITRHTQKSTDPAYRALLKQNRDYIDKKKAMPIDAAQYFYLQHRLEAVEAAIKNFLGVKVLQHIHQEYEMEFTRRIWASKEH